MQINLSLLLLLYHGAKKMIKMLIKKQLTSNNMIAVIFVLSFLLVSYQVMARDCEQFSDGVDEDYGNSENVDFYESITGEACITKEDKKYHRSVEADWLDNTNMTYGSIFIGFPEHKLSINRDSITLEEFSLSQKDILEKKEYIFNISGTMGYKWKNFGIEVFANYIADKELHAKVLYKKNTTDIAPQHSYYIWGHMKNVSMFVNGKYYFFNYKRFSPYVGAGLGLKKNFGEIKVYNNEESKYIVGSSLDFTKEDTRKNNVTSLKETVDLSTKNPFDGLFDSVSDFVNALNWNVSAGLNYTIDNNFIFDASIKIINLKNTDFEITKDEKPFLLFSLNGPNTFGLHLGLTYKF